MIRFYINYTIQNNETNINNETEFKKLNMHTINYKDIEDIINYNILNSSNISFY